MIGNENVKRFFSPQIERKRRSMWQMVGADLCVSPSYTEFPLTPTLSLEGERE
jgi:hypothetical protein